MSPRSAELLEAARRRLRGARGVIDADPSSALSMAYYAMLYAARGALSERETYARTHRGTWQQMRKEFVDRGEFDAALLAAAQKVQPQREDSDYDAWLAPVEEARRVVELAGRFIAAVEVMLRPDV